MASSASVEHYNQQAAAMENQQHFYEWLLRVIQSLKVSPAARIVDVGCGTGELLRHLRVAGYTQLAGYDFSPGCLALAQQKLPQITWQQYDILAAPLPERYDLVLLTTVIDFVPAPLVALQHLRQSVAPGGLALITFRNRWAYWPGYYLRHLAPLLRRWPRVQHWGLWFTTPLGLRRHDQPFERTYSLAEARRLLTAAGLELVTSAGMMSLPMLWILDRPRLLGAVRAWDRWAQRWPMRAPFYQLAFVCRAAAEHEPHDD